MKKHYIIILLILSILGIIDAGYLTQQHYSNVIPPCHINTYLPILSDCGLVLKSSYSILFRIPLALIGFIHYVTISIIIFLSIFINKRALRIWILIQGSMGAIASIYLCIFNFLLLKAYAYTVRYLPLLVLPSLDWLFIGLNGKEKY